MSHESFKTIGDVTSMGIVVGTITSLLPAVAALLTIVWTIIRIYETDTIKKLVKYFKKSP